MNTVTKLLVVKLAKQHFKKNFHEFIEDWALNCTMNEVKGLKIIAAVVKHKGEKVFRPQAGKVERNPERDVRDRTMTSFYQSDYGADVNRNEKRNDLLSCIKLSELSYSQLLEYETLVYLQKWISLQDNEKFVKLVIECLKGMTSVVSTKKSSYITTNQAANSRLIDTKFTNSPSPMNQYKRTFAHRQNSALKARPSLSQTNHLSKSTKIQTYNPQFYETRMKKIMKGTDGILKWIHDKVGSSYQDTYVEKLSKTQKIKPILGSTVIKLLP